MGLFKIPQFTPDQLYIAESAEIAAESRLFISDSPLIFVGTILQDNAGGGVFTPERSYTAPSGTNGYSMQIRCKKPAPSTADIVVTLVNTVDGVGTPAGTAVATFTHPVNSEGPTPFNLPAGLGTDLVAADSGGGVHHTTRTITSVSSITGGAAGNVYEVVVLPDYATFYEIAGSTKRDITPNTRRSTVIPDRFDPARWVKYGRGETPKFEASAAHTGHVSGLSRLDGMNVTVMLEVWKEDSVLVERHFLDNWHVNVVSNRGDGNSVVEDVASGMYKGRTVFC